MKKIISTNEAELIKNSLLLEKNTEIVQTRKVYSDNIYYSIKDGQFSQEKIQQIIQSIQIIQNMTGINFIYTTEEDAKTSEINKSKLLFRQETQDEISGIYGSSSIGFGEAEKTAANEDGVYFLQTGYIRTSQETSISYPDAKSGSSFIHEILHFLGLNHPGNYNQQTPEPEDIIYPFDNKFYSIMSYVHSISGIPANLMISDIMAIRELYNLNHAANIGDSQYSKENIPYEGQSYTITDQSGLDTIETGYRANITQKPGGETGRTLNTTYNGETIRVDQIINLQEGGISSVHGGTDNLIIDIPWQRIEQGITVIARTVIENATTRNTNDFIYGNEADNIIKAGDGRNFIRLNSEVFENKMDGNNIAVGGLDKDVITGGNGRDIIIGGSLGTSGDAIYGNFGNDILIGSVGKDTILGEGDNDIIVGLIGDDVLEGGDGADTFILVEAGDDYKDQAGDVRKSCWSPLDTDRLAA